MIRKCLKNGTKLNRGVYIIDGILGSGGFGVTYYGHDTKLKRKVAIKEFYPFDCKRFLGRIKPAGEWDSERFMRQRNKFLEEGQTLAKLAHPGIVSIYSVFEQNNTVYIVMEFIEGLTLRDYYQSCDGGIPITECIEMGCKVGEALTKVHDLGLLHHDIKPDNIMRRPDGEVILIDFGAARDFGRNLPNNHTVIVTPGYAPPEQHFSDSIQDTYTDVYGLAATLYFLLTGIAPLDVLSRIEENNLRPPREIRPEIPAKISITIMKALELNKEIRTQNVNLFLQELGWQIKQAYPARLATLEAEALRTFIGHKDSVSSLAISPDGKYVISGCSDSTLKLWKINTGECIRTFNGHRHAVRSVAYSHDGKSVLSGSADDTLILWDISTGKQIHTFKGHEHYVVSVAMNPIGGNCISCTDTANADNSIILWDLNKGVIIRRFPGHASMVWCTAISPDGKTALTGSFDRTLKLWDLFTGKCLKTLTGHNSSISCVAFSPNGMQAVSGNKKHDVPVKISLKLWDIKSGDWIQTLSGHQSSITSVAFSPDGMLAISSSKDETVRIWSLKNGKCIYSFTPHDDYVNQVNFCPDGNHIITGSEDCRLKLWRINI